MVSLTMLFFSYDTKQNRKNGPGEVPIGGVTTSREQVVLRSHQRLEPSLESQPLKPGSD